MYEANVAAGAEWLDENYPGWEHRIDLGTLHMGYCANCIVGQSVRNMVQHDLDAQSFFCWFGESAAGEHATEWLSDHGFDLYMYPASGWEPLEEAWTVLIKERFNSGLLSDAPTE